MAAIGHGAHPDKPPNHVLVAKGLQEPVDRIEYRHARATWIRCPDASLRIQHQPGRVDEFAGPLARAPVRRDV